VACPKGHAASMFFIIFGSTFPLISSLFSSLYLLFSFP
jgi:hypothetical protein